MLPGLAHPGQERLRGGRVPSLPGVGYQLSKFAGINNQSEGCGTAFPFWSAGSVSPRAARARGRSLRGMGTACPRPRSSYRLRAGRLSESLYASAIFEAGHLTLLLFQARSDLMLNKQATSVNSTTAGVCDRSSEVIHRLDHRIGEYLYTNRTSPRPCSRTRLGGSLAAKVCKHDPRRVNDGLTIGVGVQALVDEITGQHCRLARYHFHHLPPKTDNYPV